MRNAAAAIVVVFGAACASPIQSGPLIDQYRAARCVDPTRVSGPARGWDTALTTAKGEKVGVSGATMVSGRVVANYPADHVEVVAAQPGDYIYPSDVRIDSGRFLIVRAGGAAAGIWYQTWLFAFDLDERRQVARARVDPAVLPDECPMKDGGR